MRLKSVLLIPFVCLMAAQAQQVGGELKQWHDVVLTFDGPATSEAAAENPFFDYRLNVTFTKGTKKITVPGYYAADGNAAETSAAAGNKWRAHFVPDEVGEWAYSVSFRKGPRVAVSFDASAGAAVKPDGATGKFTIAASDKTGRDHRAQGTLKYVGQHYAQYAGSKRYFIQMGSQSPENFLAYWEFDGTKDHGGSDNKLRDGLHRYEPHVKDWRAGDPVWQGGKGKGIIGALNYLAGKGMNTFYSVTMSVGGDGCDIFPWTSYDERARYDVSKLDQWGIVMSHMDRLGMQLMVITQEEENEQILGKMTDLRKLYYRELIARFAHHHAILWDLSEEMDRWRYYKTKDIEAICDYFKRVDPYQHPIQYVQWKGELVPDDKGYGRLIGFPRFDGTAMQHDPEYSNEATRKWVDASAKAGHKWLVGIIEINPTSSGVVPDAADYWHDRIRKNSIWGNLMAGGSGQVYFFGYDYPNGDLDMEDWRTRDHFWDLMRHAHTFFTEHLPFHEMRHANALTTSNDDFVFAKPGEVYAVYLPNGGAAELDLTGLSGPFDVKWYDARNGGALQAGTVGQVSGGGKVMLGEAPAERGKDWAVLVKRAAGAVEKPAFGGEARSFMVKLQTPVGSAVSKAGDAVWASVISPETYLGAPLRGVVESAGAGKVRIAFHTLETQQRTIGLTSVLTDYVTSLGYKLKDDAGRPAKVEDGALVGATGVVWLDEGSELKLKLTEKQ